MKFSVDSYQQCPMLRGVTDTAEKQCAATIGTKTIPGSHIILKLNQYHACMVQLMQ